MDYSVTFARHFSRLVWLLLNESGNIDEQKAALRALVTVCKDGAVALAVHDWQLTVNGQPLPEALTGVQDLAAQLIGHAVRELDVDEGAAPADLLGVARILATEPVPGDGGANVEAKLRELGARTVRVRVTGPALPPPRRPTPARSVAAASAGHGTPPAAPPAAPPADAPTLYTDETSGSYLAFAAVQTRSAPSELLAQLDATRSVNLTTRLLDELGTLAENAARDGKSDTAAEVFHAIVVREAQVTDAELKRAYGMALRRMTKPTLLRSVATLVAGPKAKLDELLLVLSRAGEDGADALIEQLTSAQSLADRRAFFDALVKLNAGVPALIHMLGDARWYVVRNAADLLGEMQAKEAEVPLLEVLKHDDDRVRRAAAAALAKLGTPRAAEGLHAAMRDSSAQVRMQAAIGLGGRKGGRGAITLVRALEDEPDPEVQLALLSALGRLATPDAVQRLIKAAEPEGRLFKKKSTAYRVAAVQALAEARTPAAVAALQELARDKDKEVAEAVIRATVGKS